MAALRELHEFDGPDDEADLNLTVSQRDAAVRMSVAGASLKEIANHFGRSPQEIGRLLKKYHSTGTTADKPRSGRLPVLSRY
jgi:transposase